MHLDATELLPGSSRCVARILHDGQSIGVVQGEMGEGEESF